MEIIGHLGGDPEMKYLANATAVTNFSVATNNNYTNQQGQKVSETTWFRVSAWGKLAENCNQYLKKGSRVLVEGMLQADKATGSPRTFQRNDGTVGASFELKANHVLFLSTVVDEHGEEAVEEAVDDLADSFVL